MWYAAAPQGLPVVNPSFLGLSSDDGHGRHLQPITNQPTSFSMHQPSAYERRRGYDPGPSSALLLTGLSITKIGRTLRSYRPVTIRDGLCSEPDRETPPFLCDSAQVGSGIFFFNRVAVIVSNIALTHTPKILMEPLVYKSTHFQRGRTA